MNQNVDLARQQLALAKTMAAQVEQERQKLVSTLDPRRSMVDPEELRLMRELSSWIDKQYRAEHAIAKAQDGTPGVAGKQGQYQWLTSVDYGISTLLRLCPHVVLGKRLAVTSIDSGTLRPTEEEKSRGWRIEADCKVYRGRPDGSREDRDDWRVAVSPILLSIDGLPNETHDECCQGYDEWYAFDREVPVSDMEVFVNWGGLRLYDPVWQWAIDRFWNQMRMLNPESYIADGTVFTFATRNADLFNMVVAKFLAEPSDP